MIKSGLVIGLNLVLALVLAGCASHGKPPPPAPITNTVYVVADCDEPPQRRLVEFKPVSWRILAVNDEVLFTLTTEQYEHLSYNTSENIAAVKELKAEIRYYVDCLANQARLGE